MTYKLLLPTTALPKDAKVCYLMGLDVSEEDHTGATWKEVFVYRNPAVVHVFNLVSHGRRMLRSQIY